MKDYSKNQISFESNVMDSGKWLFQRQLQGFDSCDVLIDGGTKTRALVRYHKNEIHEFTDDRRIEVSIDTPIRQGSVVQTLKDGNPDRTFLVLSRINEDGISKFCLARETNFDLKWINKNDELIVKPSIINAKTLYTTGVKNENTLQIPNGMVGIQLPADADTKKLKRNDRFVFNNTRYKLTFYNDAEFQGLIALICEEDLVDINCDDMEMKVANRWRKDGTDRLGLKDRDLNIKEKDEDTDEDDSSLKITPKEKINDEFVLVWDKEIDYYINTQSLVEWRTFNNKLKIIKKGKNTVTVAPNGLISLGESGIIAKLPDGTVIKKPLTIIQTRG